MSTFHKRYPPGRAGLSNNDKIVSEETSNAPELCNNCCEFFGSKHNEGLCSKCFKEKTKTDQKVPSITTPALPEVSNHLKDTAPASEESSRKTSAEEEKPAEEVKALEEVVKEKPKETNKCSKCSKKVSLLGFPCKCGATFCKAHRLPEDHDCEYDFKSEAKAKLNKDNPLVQANKINKI